MAEQIAIDVSEKDADPERLDSLTYGLRADLAERLDLVRAAPGAPAPPGARAIDVAAIGALLVSVAEVGTSLNDIVTVVRGWLSAGRPTNRTVKITIGDDTLELSDATLAQQTELVDLYVRRHSR